MVLSVTLFIVVNMVHTHTCTYVTTHCRCTKEWQLVSRLGRERRCRVILGAVQGCNRPEELKRYLYLDFLDQRMEKREAVWEKLINTLSGCTHDHHTHTHTHSHTHLHTCTHRHTHTHTDHTYADTHACTHTQYAEAHAHVPCLLYIALSLCPYTNL